MRDHHIQESQGADINASQVTQFFKHLPGGICNILGIDIEYADRPQRMKADHFHTASISLWVSKSLEDPVKVTRKLNRQVFRRQDGSAAPGEGEISQPVQRSPREC